jgi:hypothetical protein
MKADTSLQMMRSLSIARDTGPHDRVMVNDELRNGERHDQNSK